MITDAESPAADPKKFSSAGAKSPELIPCRYINGSTSDTFGLLRHHGGTITLLNPRRSPVPSSMRWSFTRGASISIPPAAVVIVRATAWPLRVTSRRPFSSRSSAKAAT